MTVGRSLAAKTCSTPLLWKVLRVMGLLPKLNFFLSLSSPANPPVSMSKGRRHVWQLNFGMLIILLGVPYMCKQFDRHAFMVHYPAATTEINLCCEVCKQLQMLGTSLIKHTGERSNMPVCASMWKVNRCPSPRAHRRYGTPSNCANNTLLGITCSSTSGLALPSDDAMHRASLPRKSTSLRAQAAAMLTLIQYTCTMYELNATSRPCLSAKSTKSVA